MPQQVRAGFTGRIGEVHSDLADHRKTVVGGVPGDVPAAHPGAAEHLAGGAVPGDGAVLLGEAEVRAVPRLMRHDPGPVRRDCQRRGRETHVAIRLPGLNVVDHAVELIELLLALAKLRRFGLEVDVCRQQALAGPQRLGRRVPCQALPQVPDP